MEYLIFGLIAYLLGSIPTAVWVGKAWYGKDVREHGSKNAGATNTFRVLGKKPGIVVLSVDIIKGAFAVMIPVLAAHWLNLDTDIIHLKIVSAICVVLGHVFPLYANFNGGKGVATSLGVIFALNPLAAAISLGVFLIVFISFNYVSLGSICASISFPAMLFVLGVDSWSLKIFGIILGALVILAHRKNIQRLLSGEEGKMNLFKR